MSERDEFIRRHMNAFVREKGNSSWMGVQIQDRPNAPIIHTIPKKYHKRGRLIVPLEIVLNEVYEIEHKHYGRPNPLKKRK